MTTTRMAALTIVLSIGFSSVALARPEIPYNSFSGTVINFDSLAGSPGLGSGEQLLNQYAGLGVTFSTGPQYGAFANTSIASLATLQSDPNVIWVDQGGGGTVGAGGLDINFSTPALQVGMWFGGSVNTTFTFTMFNGATQIDQFTKIASVQGDVWEDFVGMQAGGPITRVNVACSPTGGTVSFNFSIDDLKFNVVPAPGALALLGLAGIAGLRRRR